MQKDLDELKKIIKEFCIKYGISHFDIDILTAGRNADYTLIIQDVKLGIKY